MKRTSLRHCLAARIPQWVILAGHGSHRERLSDKGFTLIEMVVGCAITAILGLVVAGILFNLLSSERFYLAQTDRYESLRLPAALIVDDLRHTWSIDTCGTSSVILWMDQAGSDKVKYSYRPLGGGRHELHRERDTGGGAPPGDEVVATNLVQPNKSSGILTSGFECTSGTSIHYILALRPTTAGGNALRFDGTAFQR